VLITGLGTLVRICAPEVPIAPLPDCRVSVPAVERLVLAAWVMDPVPLAAKAIDDPETLVLMAIPRWSRLAI